MSNGEINVVSELFKRLEPFLKPVKVEAPRNVGFAVNVLSHGENKNCLPAQYADPFVSPSRLPAITVAYGSIAFDYGLGLEPAITPFRGQQMAIT